MSHIHTIALMTVLAAAAATSAVHAQLSWAWMVPAAAHARGVGNTYWYTDLSLHNPHDFDLPIEVFFLPSDRNNLSTYYIELTLYPWETYNLWDVLGPEVFDWNGTGALLIYTDEQRISCPSVESCAFGVFSRTYTPDPLTDWGEFGQGIPGLSSGEGLDWDTFGYIGGVLNDGTDFRCNAGVASWTDDWVTVYVDVQSAAGSIVSTEAFDVPPYGHVQHRVQAHTMGGALVFYIIEGPADALVFPYASVVNQSTGDPTFLAAEPSRVGVSVTSTSANKDQGTVHRSHPQPLDRIEVGALRARSRSSAIGGG